MSWLESLHIRLSRTPTSIKLMLKGMITFLPSRWMYIRFNQSIQAMPNMLGTEQTLSLLEGTMQARNIFNFKEKIIMSYLRSRYFWYV